MAGDDDGRAAAALNVNRIRMIADMNDGRSRRQFSPELERKQNVLVDVGEPLGDKMAGPVKIAESWLRSDKLSLNSCRH